MKSKIYLLSQTLLIIGLAACSTNKSADPEFKYTPLPSNQSTDTGTGKTISSITFPGANKMEENSQTIEPFKKDKLNPAHGQPGHICDTIAGAANKNIQAPITAQQQTGFVPSTINSNSTTDKSLNPAHGQPGHRCDIAVGATLNRKPVSVSNQKQPTVIPAHPKATVTTSNAANNSINPAHGQPGHRCDIAVGSPLNSNPVSKPTIVAPQNQPAIVNANTPGAATKWGAALESNPVAIQQNKPAVANKKAEAAPGMNPSHGEPGHRCDIAVGTSLSQPIVKQEAAKK